MTRTRALLGSALFLVFAPGTLAGAIPYAISRWSGASPLPLTVLGAVLVLGGGALLLECFARFALKGLGTPAPIAPPTRLVVTGAYRLVRNPMYVAVVALTLGQAALFGSVALVIYGLVLWAGFHAFVLGYEEPTLWETFPEDYARFTAAVPRWLPRLTPWRG